MSSVFNLHIAVYDGTVFKEKTGITEKMFHTIFTASPVPQINWYPGTLRLEDITMTDPNHATTNIDVTFSIIRDEPQWYKFKKGTTVIVERSPVFDKNSNIIFMSEDIEKVVAGGRRKKSIRRRKHRSKKSRHSRR